MILLMNNLESIVCDDDDDDLQSRRSSRLCFLHNYQSRVSTRRHCYDTTVFVTKFVDVFWYIVV